jgi:hypothetical protein
VSIRSRFRSRVGGSLPLVAVLVPALGWAAPTPLPPAPPQQLGPVVVVQETRGTRTVVDSAGRTHLLMRRITHADRKAAAARAKATREAALLRQQDTQKASDTKGERR